jgi:hypothetical protein
MTMAEISSCGFRRRKDQSLLSPRLISGDLRMDEPRQSEVAASRPNLNSFHTAFLPDALTEFRSHLLDTGNYPSSQKAAAQEIEGELKTLQDGIVSMPADDWRSRSEKLQDRLEAENEEIKNESGTIIAPSPINEEIYRIAMTHLGKMNEVVASPQTKSEYERALRAAASSEHDFPPNAENTSENPRPRVRILRSPRLISVPRTRPSSGGIDHETVRQMASGMAGARGMSTERPVTTPPITFQEYRRSTDTSRETSAARQSTEQAGTTAAPLTFTEDDARASFPMPSRNPYTSSLPPLSVDQRSVRREAAEPVHTLPDRDRSSERSGSGGR